MQVLNPTHEDRAVAGERAPRLADLNGKVIGIISNGKERTVPFFDAMEAILRHDHGVAEVVRRVKPNYSAPAPDDLLAESRGWDAVLAGVGD